MKICFIGSSKVFFSGISAHTIFHANAFAELGHEVSVVLLRNLVPRFLYPGKKRLGANECIVDYNSKIKVYEGLDWNSPVSWIGAIKFLNEVRPDAVIMLWWTSSVIHMQLLLALALRALGRPPLILEMHEVLDPLEEKFIPLRIYSRLGGRCLMSLCRGFTVHSGDVRESVKKAYGLPQDLVNVIPFGVYNSYSNYDRTGARHELNLNKFVILHFGMIRKYKGIPLLIKAFEMLPQEIALNSQLVIAGENWGDDPCLEKMIKESHYSSSILYKPEFIPDSLVPKYFSAADVIVLPYLRSCGSGVVHLALAQGKPVLTSDLPVMRESLKGYGGAGFFPVGDAEVLKKKLIDTYLCWQSGVLKDYKNFGATWDNVAKNYMQIIEGLAVGTCG